MVNNPECVVGVAIARASFGAARARARPALWWRDRGMLVCTHLAIAVPQTRHGDSSCVMGALELLASPRADLHDCLVAAGGPEIPSASMPDRRAAFQLFGPVGRAIEPGALAAAGAVAGAHEVPCSSPPHGVILLSTLMWGWPTDHEMPRSPSHKSPAASFQTLAHIRACWHNLLCFTDQGGSLSTAFPVLPFSIS